MLLPCAPDPTLLATEMKAWREMEAAIAANDRAAYVAARDRYSIASIAVTADQHNRAWRERDAAASSEVA